jgi:hypothetical protein
MKTIVITKFKAENAKQLKCMKKRLFINICMWLIFLSSAVGLSAQVAEPDIEEWKPAVYPTETDSLSSETMLPETAIPVDVLLRSCVSLFANQTISSNISALGCGVFAVQNITVTAGTLSLTAPAGVTFNGSFEVRGALSIQDGGSPPPPPPPPPLQASKFTYTYDASGNRIGRVAAP